MILSPELQPSGTLRRPHVLQMYGPSGGPSLLDDHQGQRLRDQWPEGELHQVDLGTESIQGIEARGRLHTTTIPAGAIGNDEPLVSTKEVWTAITAGLNGLLVRDTSNDPRQGKTTRELTNLSPGDPESTTFQPPEGYEIVTRDSPGCQDQAPAETRSTTTSK